MDGPVHGRRSESEAAPDLRPQAEPHRQAARSGQSAQRQCRGRGEGIRESDRRTEGLARRRRIRSGRAHSGARSVRFLRSTGVRHGCARTRSRGAKDEGVLYAGARAHNEAMAAFCRNDSPVVRCGVRAARQPAARARGSERGDRRRQPRHSGVGRAGRRQVAGPSGLRSDLGAAQRNEHAVHAAHRRRARRRNRRRSRTTVARVRRTCTAAARICASATTSCCRSRRRCC